MATLQSWMQSLPEPESECLQSLVDKYVVSTMEKIATMESSIFVTPNGVYISKNATYSLIYKCICGCHRWSCFIPLNAVYRHGKDPHLPVRGDFGAVPRAVHDEQLGDV